MEATALIIRSVRSLQKVQGKTHLNSLRYGSSFKLNYNPISISHSRGLSTYSMMKTQQNSSFMSSSAAVGRVDEGFKLNDEVNDNLQNDQVIDTVAGDKMGNRIVGNKGVVSPENSKLLKVAIIGLPNAGKSTLINSFMSLGVCPVSKRVHTTRTNQKAILLHEETQVVFIDTPGLVNMKDIKKFSFPKDFVFGPEKSIALADVVVVMHDLSNIVTRNKLDPRVVGILEKFPDKNCILILNKIDTVKTKRTLLDTVRILTSGMVGGRPIRLKKSPSEKQKDQKQLLEMENLLKRAKERSQRTETERFQSKEEKEKELANLAKSSFSEDELKEGMHLCGWSKFNDVFMISALNGDGVDLIKEYFVVNARPSPWMFGEDFLTDIEPSVLAIRIIKSKLLDHLPQEIPYQLDPKIEFWDQKENGELRIIVLLKCSNERYMGRVVGTGASVINRITSESESILISLLRVSVNLTIKPFVGKKAD